TVAGRPPRITQGAARDVDDLVLVVARERDLARAREVQVVALEVVDLVRVRAEKARARHDLGPHEGRRDERGEARLECTVEGEVHERELESRPDALEEVETRPADLRA